MPILLVVDNPDRWPLSLPRVNVLAARQYLIDPAYNNMRNARVVNLCRSYSYQSLGYYVSLIAEARGHRPQPDVVTIQDMKSTALARVITDDLDALIQKTLRPIRSGGFTLSVYFGKTLAKRDSPLGQKLFNLFRSPLLRAQFVRKREWQLQSIRPIPASEIPESHHEEVIAAAHEYFTRRQWSGSRTRPARYEMAILVDPNEGQPPSDQQAIGKFIRAAQRQDVSVELITNEDFDRLGEFDALFIRTTTFVNHYTYRFARRAAAEGLVVIDDPVSIARCTNKVYLAERLGQNHVPIPPTVIVHRDNVDAALQQLGLPCVLKQPDSAFSAGVVKVATPEEYRAKVVHLLDDSELIVAQKYIPTDFDWRVGVLDGQPLYVCKYYMARNHWQIQRRHDDGRLVEGRAETFPIDQAPPKIVSAGCKAARLIGDGLYGVDLKQIDGHIYVMEVNDNPNIDGGIEDQIAKDQLYDQIVSWFVRRIERIREGAPRRAGQASAGIV